MTQTLIDNPRILTYAFLTLPYHVRINIVRDLGLVKGKAPLSQEDFFAKCFRKAKADKKLAELWDAVYKESKDDQKAKMGVDNPYKIEDKPADSITVSYLDGYWDQVHKTLVSSSEGKQLSNGTIRIKSVEAETKPVPTDNGPMIRRRKIMTIIEETFSKV